ncbi:MAG: isoaspartyl peptidase/L-asparaginase [Maricaulaceae bacterium]|nr:isoaspartyl peptidase/L-asparaginase [Maricaulaceae bacterium]
MRIIAAVAAACSLTAAATADEPRWALVIHGGAGVIERDSMTAEAEALYREALAIAVDAGADILRGGGSALDAVEAMTRLMEDDPLFNAGRGAVFTAAGRVEHDASIMDGATLNAGASAGTTNVRHPISLARAVMERSRHVMLQGPGAETFAAEQGLEVVHPAYFFTERRWRALERALEAQGLPIPPRPEGAPEPEGVDHTWLNTDTRFGTVGAVAVDMDGNIAAATTTGGMTAKRWGRVGDSPIIGAGTYASNASCGVSATGTGEYFIRLNIAARICALVELQGLSIQDAADRVIGEELTALSGDGGVVAMTPDGAIAWAMNTSGMYRARASSDAPPVVAIFADEG